MPTIVARGAITIVRQDDGYTCVLSNEAQTVVATSAGVVTPAALAATVCKIAAYKGATPLSPVGSNVTPGGGQFRYDITTTIGGVAARQTNDVCVLSSISADTVEIRLTINCENQANFSKVITISKAKAGSDADVENLKIGGRNMLLNSNFASGATTPWYGNNNVISVVADARFGFACKASTDGTNGKGIFQRVNKRVAGETYSWSVWLRADTARALWINHDGGLGHQTCNVTPDWQIFKGTGKWDGPADAFWVHSKADGITGHIYIANAKYESGNKATDWTPAPEDVQSSIDAAKALANAAQAANTALVNNIKSMAYQDFVEFAKLGNSIIEGGHVKLSLLDAIGIRSYIVNADYVNTLDLDAKSIKSGTMDSERINASEIIVRGGGRKNLLFPDRLNLSAGSDIAVTDYNRFAASLNGGASQSRVELGVDPFGNTSLLWKCIEVTNVGAEAGGFHSLEFLTDGSKAYRFSFAFKQNGYSAFFLGASQNGATMAINGGVSNNPYFCNGAGYGGQWLLAVGYLLPHNTHAQSNMSGIYSFETGEKIADGVDWRASDYGQLYQYMRAYQYYATYGAVTYIYNPMVELIDGSEPSIAALLGRDAITLAIAKNATYLANAAQAANTALVNNIKSMAYQDFVEFAKLGDTIIEGGHVKLSLLDAVGIRSYIVNATYVQTLDLVAKRVAANHGYIGGFNIVNKSLVAGSNSDSPSAWDLRSANIMLYTDFSLFRKIGGHTSQTQEVSINLGYYPPSAGGGKYKDAMVLKSNIRNTYGGGAVPTEYRHKNRALILEAKNSDENIALEVMSGHVYLRDVVDIGGPQYPTAFGYIKYYTNESGFKVLVLDTNAPPQNLDIPGDEGQFLNDAQTGWATKQGCTGYDPQWGPEVGSYHEFTVPAGTFSSFTSKAEANSLALVRANQLAQQEADNYGHCYYEGWTQQT